MVLGIKNEVVVFWKDESLVHHLIESSVFLGETFVQVYHIYHIQCPAIHT